MLFISALRIFYLEPSNDPIFPANEPIHFGDDKRAWYYKSDPKATVLACLDKTELCDPEGQSCWSMKSSPGDKRTFPPSYWLMNLALEFSNTYESISTRLGDALVAQERISQFTSLALNDTHWQVEAARLFATSLARIQFDAWSIASGEDRAREGPDGFVNQTPDEAGDLCGFFVFKSRGFFNFDVALYFGFLAVLPVSFILSHELGRVGLQVDGAAPEQVPAENTAGDRDEASDFRSARDEDRLIVLDVITWFIIWTVTSLCGGAVALWRQAWRRAVAAIEGIQH